MTTMLSRYLVAFALAVGLCAGQASNDAGLDEAMYRQAVEEGHPNVPGDPVGRAMMLYEHSHDAIPILVSAVKPKLNGSKPNWFVWTSVDAITRYLNQSSVDAVDELCAASRADCPWLVKSLMAQAAAYQRDYEFAYLTIERHPGLIDPVVSWVRYTMDASSVSEKFFARELLKRDKAGHPIGQNDRILERLSDPTRVRIARAVEALRNEEQQQPRSR